MKLMSEISKKYVGPQEEKLVHAIQNLFHLDILDTPILSSQIKCPLCNGSNGMICMIDPNKGKELMWFCQERICLASVINSRSTGMIPLPTHSRAILWGKFAEINGIGDENEDVKFESINQSQPKLDALLKFSQNPRSIILMQGAKGTGKTYAAMGACEYFTRTNHSCIFSTQKQMFNSWLETFKSEGVNNYTSRVNNCSLLVIDDFGIAEISPAFMSFFMDLINTRMQWKNRGTIITTNLTTEKLSEYCGDALMDRLNTGVIFQFSGSTRRKPTIL